MVNKNKEVRSILGGEIAKDDTRLDNETFKHWYEQTRRGDERGQYYVFKIIRGIDLGEPLAIDFVRRAMKVDRDFINRSPFKAVAETLEEQERQKKQR